MCDAANDAYLLAATHRYIAARLHAIYATTQTRHIVATSLLLKLVYPWRRFYMVELRSLHATAFR